MDKNFVHIDDLFRQGLSGGEEPEQSGAWLRMQDLLDKEIPVTPVTRGRSPYRRYLASLLLLLLGGGTGAYVWYHQYQLDNKVAVESGMKGAAGHEVEKTSLAKTGYTSLVSAKTAIPASTMTAPAITLPVAIQPSAVSPVHASSGRNTRMESLKQPAAVTSTRSISADPRIENAAVAKANEVREIKMASLEPAMFASSDLKKAEKEILQAAARNGLYATKGGNILKETNKEMTEITVKEIPVYSTADARRGHNHNKTPIRTDTISMQKRDVKVLEPITLLEMAAISKYELQAVTDAKLLDQSYLFASGERAVSLVTLSKFEVASRKTTPEKINEMVGSTKATVTNMFDGTKKFYAGLLVGGNYSIASPSAMGIHLGLGGYYSLSERWTVAGEIRYVNRFLNNYSYADQYNTYSNITSQSVLGSFEYDYDVNKYEQLYKVKNMATLEVPVYLNYSIGRMSVFGGVNLAYAFKMNSVKSTNIFTESETATSPSSVFPYANGAGTVTAADFSSRLGLGYVAGVQYDINRKYSIDFRASQILVDNASGDISKRISSQTFRVPSVQLGLHMYFGKREKVMYMMTPR